jgi:hypothetical protein
MENHGSENIRSPSTFQTRGMRKFAVAILNSDEKAGKRDSSLHAAPDQDGRRRVAEIDACLDGEKESR